MNVEGKLASKCTRGNNSPFYVAARETARLLSQGGLSVITGGGPGIMAAANEGAKLGANGNQSGC